VLIEPDYKGYRIEANAVSDGDRWNCDVIVRRTLSQDKPHREGVTCFEVTPALAEQAGALWPRRWIDLHVANG
jgi:hypothetical protein